jgi:lipopolysaccharide biosynthesis regulator YciM
MRDKYILIELVVVEWMNKRNHSDCEFHEFLILLVKIFKILHPENTYNDFDHYSPECFNEFRKLISEVKKIPAISALLNHLVGVILTDEMRDKSKKELIDYYIVVLNEACELAPSFACSSCRPKRDHSYWSC